MRIGLHQAAARLARSGACCLAFFLAVSSSGTPAASEESGQVVRLGALIDQTGASTTPLFRSAVELAAVQMNNALARAGSRTRFEFMFGDTRSDPSRARAEALRLINDEHVRGLVADSSGDTLAAARLNYAPDSGAAHKVAITCFQCSSSFIHDPAATDVDPFIQAAERDPDHWTFRVFYNARFEAAVIVRLALQRAGKSPGDPFNVAIFADAGHRSLAAGIADVLPTTAGARATARTTYVTTPEAIGPDWARVVRATGTAQAGDAPPDLVIVAMLPAAATEAVRTYRSGGFGIPILSNNSFRRDYILAGVGPSAEGLEGSSVALVDDSLSGKLFLDAFRAATNHLPEHTSSGTYDSAVTLMLAALVAQGRRENVPTPADIRTALTRINDRAGTVIRPAEADFVRAVQQASEGRAINYEGAYDPLDWDESGEIFPPLVHWKVDGGRFVELEAYDCKPTAPLCARR